MAIKVQVGWSQADAHVSEQRLIFYSLACLFRMLLSSWLSFARYFWEDINFFATFVYFVHCTVEPKTVKDSGVVSYELKKLQCQTSFLVSKKSPKCITFAFIVNLKSWWTLLAPLPVCVFTCTVWSKHFQQSESTGNARSSFFGNAVELSWEVAVHPLAMREAWRLRTNGCLAFSVEPERTNSPVVGSATKVRGILAARSSTATDPTATSAAFLSLKSAHHVCTQVLQLLHILFENIREDTSLYFLLSNNFINQIIGCVYDFTDDEVRTLG